MIYLYCDFDSRLLLISSPAGWVLIPALDHSMLFRMNEVKILCEAASPMEYLV